MSEQPEVEKVAKQTRVQWGAIGAVLLAAGSLAAWNYDAIRDLAIGSAQAQATAKGAEARIEQLERRHDVDAGATNAKLERREGKIDELHREQREFFQVVLKKLERR